MSDSSVIREFLYSIGFFVDANGVAKFKTALEKADKQVANSNKGLGALVKELSGFKGTLLAVAESAGVIAFGAAIEGIATRLDDLYWKSKLLRSSAADIQAFKYSLSQVGGSQAGAEAALAGFSDALSASPGTESILHQLGIQTRDANFQLRDTATMLGEVGQKLKAMSGGVGGPREYVARQFAQMLGIPDRATLEALMRDQSRFSDNHKKFAKAIGLDLDKATESANRFKTAEREMFDDLDMLVMKGGGDFLDWLDKVGAKHSGELGKLADDADRLAHSLKALFGDIDLSDGFDKSLSFVVGFIDAILQEIQHLAQAMADLKRGDFAGAGREALAGIRQSPLGQIVAGSVEHYTNAPKAAPGRAPGPAAARPGGSGPAASPRPVAPPTKGATSRYEQLRGMLEAAGIHGAAAAGIAAGMMAESHGKNDAVPRDKHGRLISSAYGLAQWMADKRAMFTAFMGRSLTGASDADQIKFLVHQLTAGSETAAGKAIMGAKTPQAALEAFIRQFERPNPKGGGDSAALGDIARGRAFLASGALTGSGGIYMSQQTTITVHGGADAGATGKAVASAQSRVNGDMVRNLKTAVV